MDGLRRFGRGRRRRRKRRVHLFTCVLALAIAHLMRREATRAGLPLSVSALLAELEGIGETVLLYPGDRGRPWARHTITRLTPHPAAPLPAVRPRPVRPAPLTWVIRPTEDRKQLGLRKPGGSLKIIGNSG